MFYFAPKRKCKGKHIPLLKHHGVNAYRGWGGVGWGWR